MYACADIHHAQLLHALLVSDINYQSSSILKQMRMALFSTLHLSNKCDIKYIVYTIILMIYTFLYSYCIRLY